MKYDTITEIVSDNVFADADENALEGRVFSSRISNTLLDQQWYIEQSLSGSSTQTDLGAMWSRFSGAQHSIAVIDSGFQFAHLDLTDRLDASRNASAGAYSASNDHGTQVSGVLGADADNDFGIVGIAYGAALAPVRLDYASGSIQRADVAAALTLGAVNDVINASWGYRVQFQDSFADAKWDEIEAAITDAAANGRDGLGTVTVFAAGNDRQYVRGSATVDGDNTNYHSLTNARQIITVAASDQNDRVASFSTPGASIMVAAPGVSILTSGVVAGKESATDGFETVSGTSFAAPIVSGVIALMLEANPALGYRDVQTILAMTAKRPDSAEWTTNGATTWNGGGLEVNEDLGFGIVDASAAVRLAATWTLQSTASNETSQLLAPVQTGAAALADGATVSSGFDAASGINVEWVEIDVQITHPHVGDLTITVTSPSGHVSTLVDRPANGNNTRDDLNFTLTSAHFRGETSEGRWTVDVSDASGNGAGSVERVAVRIFGAEASPDTVHVLTDDVAGRLEPVTISDADGDNTLNMAAVSHDLSVRLKEGSVELAGTTVRIAEGSTFSSYIAGAGNDILSAEGQQRGVALFGNDGDDAILGGEGSDLLSGGDGADKLLDTGGYAPTIDQQRLSRLYEAAFERLPDAHGFADWSQALQNGVTIGTIAEKFIGSQEFLNTFNGSTSSEIIEQFYFNVLNRQSETEGKNYWIEKFESGYSLANILLGFSDSEEFQINTGAFPALVAHQKSDAEAAGAVFDLFSIALGRLPEAAELDAWKSIYLATLKAEDLAGKMVASAAFQDQFFKLDQNEISNDIINRTSRTFGDASIADLKGETNSIAGVIASLLESHAFGMAAEPARKAYVSQLYAAQNDTLNGGAGDDLLFGGLGADAFVFNQRDGGSDRLFGIDSTDSLRFQGFGFQTETDVLAHMQQADRDVIFSHAGVNVTIHDTSVAFIRDHGLIAI